MGFNVGAIDGCKLGRYDGRRVVGFVGAVGGSTSYSYSHVHLRAASTFDTHKNKRSINQRIIISETIVDQAALTELVKVPPSRGGVERRTRSNRVGCNFFLRVGANDITVAMQVSRVDGTVRIRIRAEDGRKGFLVVISPNLTMRKWNLDTGEFMYTGDILPEFMQYWQST